VVGCLPSKLETLHSDPTTTKKKAKTSCKVSPIDYTRWKKKHQELKPRLSDSYIQRPIKKKTTNHGHNIQDIWDIIKRTYL
jgi:hypothetical protein